MNGTAQRKHATAVSTLENATTEAIHALSVRLRDESDRLFALIGGERTHRLKMADEQRAYVDAADAETRRSMVASDDDLGSRIRTIETLTFWGRLRWIFTGRLESRVGY